MKPGGSDIGTRGGMSEVDQAPGTSGPQPPRVRFQAPQPPSLAAVAPYYALSEAARWYSNGGPCHELLVNRLQDYVGRGAHCVPVNNATSGLIIGLRQAVGSPPGDRRLVPLPSYTFAATANAVVWAGLEPVLLDVDRDGWHLCPDELERFMKSAGHHVAAVLACSTYGTAPAPEVAQRWASIAARWEVPLLVDSAAGFGSRNVHGQVLGCQGDMEMFSFHATKPFAIGEGGAVFTRSPERATELARLSNFGFDQQRNLVGLPGLNAKLSEIQCAFALAALDSHDANVGTRQRLASTIRDALQPHGYGFQQNAAQAATQFVAALAPTVDVRARLIAMAAERNLEFRTYFSQPIHGFQTFRGARRGSLAVTAQLSSRIVSLPMSNDLDEDSLNRIISVCIDAVRYGANPSTSVSV